MFEGVVPFPGLDYNGLEKEAQAEMAELEAE
jgi:hypothetical protein